MNGYGLILGGGGAMGSYEIGVWKALRELNIKINAVAGTSVGALNGAMIIQDDFDKALELWSNITIEQIINVDTDFLDKSLFQWTKEDFSLFFALFKDFIKQGGFDTKPLHKLLQEAIHEDCIRDANMVFGINTYSITDRKPLYLYLEQIPKGKLISYLLASACLPIFKSAEIDNKKYLDGGFYDNVPINLLARKGYKNLIVVELLPINIKRPPETDNLNLITIKSSSSLGRIMEFNPQRAKANIDLGYKDTMKTFNVLEGRWW